ncbi:uncharacterized protein V1513DRAFT_406365 [Lipomyces chichibuensis]|uniref:uncharacterized protein n=1 Tax=Lipomyces chichibuensis TaxID=1546026 RepID=UPI003343B970
MGPWPFNFKARRIIIPIIALGLPSLLVTLSFLCINTDLRSSSATQTQPVPRDGRRPTIPNIVHYVHLIPEPQGKIQFELKHFISIYSASLYFSPDVIYIHTDATNDEVMRARTSDEASDKWPRLILNLPQVVVHYVTAPDYARNGQKICNLENKSDFIRAEVVYELGGVYLDWDVHPLRDFKPLREAGFTNVVGLQKDDLVNSGCFMAIKKSEMMRLWVEYEHIVYDGGWITHAVMLLTDLSRTLAMIPHEVLILERYALAPSSWERDDAQSLFGSHSKAQALHPGAAGPHRPAITLATAEMLWKAARASSREEWEKDYSSSYALHAFNNIERDHPLEDFDKITLQYVLSRQSNFARAVYPAVRHAVEAVTRKLVAVFVPISIVGLIGSIIYLWTPSIRNIDVQNIKNSLSYKSNCQESKLSELAVETFNSTYTHGHGIYANGYETSYVPGTEDVFLMIKTGASVLWQRFPIHIATTLPQLPHFAVYSDAPDVVAGIPVIDILNKTGQITMDSPQYETYRQQKTLLSQHANIELWEANINGAWNLDKYKNVPMVAHGYRTFPTAKWYIFMDADTYILWPNMMRWLSSINHDDLLYMGSVTYAGRNSPFVHGGSGVVMSGALVRSTFGKEPDLGSAYEVYAKGRCCGDSVLAQAFKDRGVFPVLSGDNYPNVSWRFQGGFCCEDQADIPANVRHNKQNWCEEITTFHHVTPHDISQLYEFEQKFPREQPILFKDVYHEFVMPYLQDGRRDNWDNLADIREYPESLNPKQVERDEEWRKEHPKQSKPPILNYDSYENCSALCRKWEELGKKQLDGNKTFSSFWFLERIRNIRDSSGCDPVNAAPEEGAFFRQQAEEASKKNLPEVVV